MDKKEVFNEYIKYDYYKENYLKKESNNKLPNVEDILNRNKSEDLMRAAIKFYKHLPEDVRKSYKTFNDYLKEFREMEDEYFEGEINQVQQKYVEDNLTDGKEPNLSCNFILLKFLFRYIRIYYNRC